MDKVSVYKSNYDHINWNQPINMPESKIWQVLCGDSGVWRCGLFSPKFSSVDEIQKLERHNCPEFFMLIEGNLSLLVVDSGEKTLIKLERYKPVMIRDWHDGFCPKGPYTGKALVVERDVFETEYEMLPNLI